MKLAWTIAAALVLAPGMASYAAQPKAKPVTVKLAPQNNSGESGTAKLTPVGDSKTKVQVTLKGGPKGVAQPAHIHEGGCANLNPKPKIGLAPIKDGKSTTTVPAPLSELTSGDLAINVHKSTDDLQTYVACGDIKTAAAGKK